MSNSSYDPFQFMDLFNDPTLYSETPRDEYFQNPYDAFLSTPREMTSRATTQPMATGPLRVLTAQPSPSLTQRSRAKGALDRTSYGGGTPDFDERGGIASIGTGAQAPGFVVGDQVFDNRDEAIDYARNVAGTPDAVGVRAAGDPEAARQPFSFATAEQLQGAPEYFGIGDKRFLDRDEALRYARATGQVEMPIDFSAGVARGGAQSYFSSLTDAERQAYEDYRNRSAQEFAETRRQAEQRKALLADIGQQYDDEQYKSKIDPKDFYTIDERALKGIRFATFDDAKKAQEKANLVGDRIRSSAGKKIFKTAQTEGKGGGVFATRKEAIKDMVDRGISKSRAEKLVRSYATGGAVSKKIGHSNIKQCTGRGHFGSLIERK